MKPNREIVGQAMNVASDGKVNTVVSKLVNSWRQLIGSESNVHLFTQLLKKGISTRDVHSFVSKQAKLRKVLKGLDKPLSRAAMRTKLNDACAFNVRQKRVVSKLKRDLFDATGQRVFKQRKIIMQVRAKMDEERKILKKSVLKKVSRYQEIQSLINDDKSIKPSTLPASIQDYSNLKAFSQPEAVDMSPDLPMI